MALKHEIATEVIFNALEVGIDGAPFEGLEISEFQPGEGWNVRNIVIDGVVYQVSVTPVRVSA
jgi:hypothetical protein